MKDRTQRTQDDINYVYACSRCIRQRIRRESGAARQRNVPDPCEKTAHATGQTDRRTDGRWPSHPRCEIEGSFTRIRCIALPCGAAFTPDALPYASHWTAATGGAARRSAASGV